MRVMRQTNLRDGQAGRYSGSCDCLIPSHPLLGFEHDVEVYLYEGLATATLRFDSRLAPKVQD